MVVRCLYEFGGFRLDAADRLLYRDNEPVQLPPKAIETLLALVEKRGHLANKDELYERVWPNTFVEEGSLTQNIFLLRKTLGDDRNGNRIIATIPKRGYRFVWPVTVREETSLAGHVVTAATVAQDRFIAAVESHGQSQAASRRRLSRWLTPVGLLLGLLAVLFSVKVGGLREWLSNKRNPPHIESLAVLPLENLTHDPAQEYFADGMTEALITELAQISALRVISRTSVMRYKGNGKSLPEIAQELKVDAVVEGSVMRSGDRVRITAELIHAPTDRHLWAKSYERDLREILRLQSEVAGAITAEIRVKLTPQEQTNLASARAVNPGAYEAYLKGRYHWNKLTLQQLQKARAYFEEAIEKDPTFALAYVGLADCYSYLGFFRWLPPQETSSKGKAAISKALELDDRLGHAHLTLAVLHWRFDWNWSAAEREFKRALELNPNYAFAHSNYAAFLALTGRVHEATTELQRARELDPVSIWAKNAGVFFLARQYDTLMESSRGLLDLEPNSWLGHLWLGFAYEGLGKIPEAIPEYQEATELSGGDTDAVAALAHAYAVTGRTAQARKMLRELERSQRIRYISPYMTATIYAGLGDKNKAFELLERSYQERASDLPWFIKADPRIDNLRSDPRFQDLLRRIGLPP